MNGDITFDSNDLQTANIITNAINHTQLPNKVVNLYQIANANASAIPYTDYPSKTITIAGVIQGTDVIVDGVVTETAQVNLDSRIDTFKGYLRGRNKNLDINYNGSTRRYIATVNTSNIIRTGTKTFASFTVEFLCTDPFGSDTSLTTIMNQANYTTATYTATPTIAGTAPSQLPIFTITVDALTGTGDYIQISDDDSGQDMVIYGYGITAGDVIIIDCAARTVKKNGVLIDYNGTFMELEPGARSITYTDGFTTRQVDILAQYYKRYL